MKLMIAVPTQDYIPMPFVESLLRLQKRLTKKKINFTVNFRSGALVYDSREQLAAKARMEEYTHVLWIDSDMVFEEDIFEKLAAHKRDYVTGICHARRAPYRSCIFYRLLPEPERMNKRMYPESLFKIEGSGFGCVLTSVKLLKDMKQQYGNLFLPNLAFGEDLAFCHKAQEMGYELFADPKVQIKHLGHVAFGQEDEIIEE